MFCGIEKSKRRIEELTMEKSELQQRIEKAEAKNEKFVEQISELNKMLRETMPASTEGNQIQINKVSIQLM